MAFQPAVVSAPAGKPFQIAFENREGPPHNVAVYRTADFKDPVSVGEIFSGPATKTQSVPALDAGTYYFRCDVHPDMKGTLIAK
jgi:plastocyanin